MVACNSRETNNMYPNLNAIPLNDQQQFRLNIINEIEDYCRNQRKKLNGQEKHIASFGYFDKLLIVLSITRGSISIASFITVIGAPIRKPCGSFSLAFSISRGIVEKTVKNNKEKEKA